jgi:hypothetical protein
MAFCDGWFKVLRPGHVRSSLKKERSACCPAARGGYESDDQTGGSTRIEDGQHLRARTCTDTGGACCHPGSRGTAAPQDRHRSARFLLVPRHLRARVKALQSPVPRAPSEGHQVKPHGGCDVHMVFLDPGAEKAGSRERAQRLSCLRSRGPVEEDC